MEKLLKTLKLHNISIKRNGDNLELNIPFGFNLPDEIINEISTHKDRLLELLGKMEAKSNFDSIPRAPECDVYDLSSAQKRLYFVYEYDRESVAYNMPKIIKITCRYNRILLGESLQELIRRHEALRCVMFFDEDGNIKQRFNKETSLHVEYKDIDEKELDHEVGRFIRPFDLQQGPMIRVALFCVSEQLHYLLMDMPHIITDGWSDSILVNEFMALYRGDTLPPVRLQYKDYIVWGQHPDRQKDMEVQKKYWVDKFRENPLPLDLPGAGKRGVGHSWFGSFFEFSLGKRHTLALHKLAEESATTLFMVMLSAYFILLSRLANRQDIVVGVPVAGRDHVDLEGIFGMFVNTVLMRTHVSGNVTYLDFLQILKREVLQSMKHQAYQYEMLVDALKLPRENGRNPLFDVMFTYENFSVEGQGLAGFHLESVRRATRKAKFDLTLVVSEKDNALTLAFEYREDLFQRSTIQYFSEMYLRILQAILDHPDSVLSEIDVLSSGERAHLIHRFNNTGSPVRINGTVLDLFGRRVKACSTAPAVICRENVLTYQELHAKANQLAHVLHTQGLCLGRLALISLDKSAEAIVAILAVLKTGAAYVPVDPGYPARRKKYILEDTASDVILTSQKYVPDWMAISNVPCLDLDQADIYRHHKTSEPQILVDPADTAYIIYTSGTTGKPKGVKVAHASLMNYISWAAQTYVMNNPKRWALHSSISFDLTVTSIFTPLCTGGEIHVYEGTDNVLVVTQLIEDNQCEIIKLTPSHLKLIQNLQPEVNFSCVTNFIVGGERLETKLAEEIYNTFNGKVRIMNEYGPTEATVGCMIHEFSLLDQQPSVPIGVPIQNTRIYLLDDNLTPVPVGTIGEIYVSGVALATEYHNQPLLTSEKFIANPFVAGERMYKTGDCARMLPNYRMEFIGRVDDQVKINGYRIELSEVEVCLQTINEIEEVAVVVRGSRDNPYLAAYYLADHSLDEGYIQQVLIRELPAYMIPALYIHVTEMPLSINGKLDRDKLPEITIKKKSIHRPPENEIQSELVKIWSSILSIDPETISIDLNFFELGGNSLSTVMLANKIHRKFNVTFPIQEIFWRPTVEKASEYLALRVWMQSIDTDAGTGNEVIDGSDEVTL